MRSTASYKGHPLHPALVPFPFAFLLGAAASDIAGTWAGGAWPVVARYLSTAGIAAALVAAVPGIVDYFYTVPPNSSGRKRATKHGLANLTVVSLFAVAWLTRAPGAQPPGALPLLLEVAGAALLLYAGWLGGTLVTRNLISVDHRYAEAGKWNEATLTPDGDLPIVVATRDELKVDQMKLLRIAGRRIALARTKDGYVAFDDSCTHRGGSLAGGVMICGTVQCLWHGSQFGGADGKVQRGPAKKGIRTYEVKESAQGVTLQLRG